MRLGTLVHLFAHSYLKDVNIPEKSEQMKWLRALKLDTQNAELFYSIGVFTYLVKADPIKAKSCAEKALLLKPNFAEALYLLCVISWNMGQHSKVVELVNDFESKYDRTMAFTYFIKGMADYQTKNYVPAIENFQNVAKFNELRQTQERNGTITKFKPNYPLFRDSV